MNCSKCGKELTNDMEFCPTCGEKIYHNVIDIIEEEKPVEENEKGPWKIFAKFGDVIGTVALCTFWVAGVGINLGVVGIVLSCLGKKSKIRYELASGGFKKSLLATILALGFMTLTSIIGVIANLINK